MNSTSTREPIIKVIDEDYKIPQLKTRRRIAALLPHDYNLSAKFYPVLYLHDGQNLFNDFAPFGNWGVDKCLSALSKEGIEVIVISIDHGGKDRIAEYMPYTNPKYNDSKGDLYINFMMNDLKPYIDKHFRVKTDRQHTGIGGSSMGGLISLYAGFNYNQIFGKMMIFSPSIWISEQTFKQASSFNLKGNTKMYLYAGGQESNSLKPSMDMLYAILKNRNAQSQFNLELFQSFNPEGKHQEHFWGLEFPKAMSWLFSNQ